jgi:hypothetical protein
MAQADQTPNTSSTAALSLNEAIALVVRLRPPHDVVAVEMEFTHALANGLLCDWFIEGDDFSQEGPTKPKVLQRWLDEGRVDTRTGVVTLPPRRGHGDQKVLTPPPFRLMFRRQDVFDYFGITEAPVSAADDSTPTKTWVINKIRQLKDAGQIPDSQTSLARVLAHQSEAATKAGELKKPLKYRYLTNQLHNWALWPV